MFARHFQRPLFEGCSRLSSSGAVGCCSQYIRSLTSIATTQRPYGGAESRGTTSLVGGLMTTSLGASSKDSSQRSWQLSKQLGGIRLGRAVTATRTYLGRGPGVPPWYGVIGINPVANPPPPRPSPERFNHMNRWDAMKQFTRPPVPKEYPSKGGWTMEKLHRSRQFFITQGEMSRRAPPRSRDNYRDKTRYHFKYGFILRRRERMVEQTIAWRLTQLKRKQWLGQFHAFLSTQYTENLALKYGHLFPDLITPGQLKILGEQIADARDVSKMPPPGPLLAM